MKDNKILNLKHYLLADSVTAADLLDAMFACKPSSSECDGFNGADLERAIRFVIDAKQGLTRNGDGKRIMEGDDSVRDSVCRMLFGIPIQNLRRREQRVAEPVESAISDCTASAPKIQSAVLPVSVRNSPRPTSSAVPVHSVEYFDGVDEDAFDGFVGNASVLKTISLQIKGALARGDAFRPILLQGASGCGKTELSRRIAKMVGRPFYSLAGSVFKTGDDVDALIGYIDKHSVIFIDEAHSISEVAIARILTLLNNICDKDMGFIFATNLSSRLPTALINRCLVLRLTHYTIDELAKICIKTAVSSNVKIDQSVANFIASRCNGVARSAVNFTRDIIVEEAAISRAVTIDNVRAFFERRGIDSMGLSSEHRRYLRVLSQLNQASSASMMAALGENDIAEIEQVIEPLLIKQGLIAITGKGRVLSDKGMAYINRAEGK